MSSGDTRGRQRARRLYALGQCEHADCNLDAYDRHHIDGDDNNNAPGNISRLCRRHHMEVDGRLHRFRTEIGRHAPLDPKPCSNCGRHSKPLRNGLCDSCRMYVRRYGRPRPYVEDGRKEKGRI